LVLEEITGAEKKGKKVLKWYEKRRGFMKVWEVTKGGEDGRKNIERENRGS